MRSSTAAPPPLAAKIRSCAAAADATPFAVGMTKKWYQGPQSSTQRGRPLGKTLLRISQSPLGRVGNDDRQDLPLQRPPDSPIPLLDSPRRNHNVKSRYPGSGEGAKSQGSWVVGGRGAGYAWLPPVPSPPDGTGELRRHDALLQPRPRPRGIGLFLTRQLSLAPCLDIYFPLLDGVPSARASAVALGWPQLLYSAAAGPRSATVDPLLTKQRLHVASSAAFPCSTQNRLSEF